MSGWVSPRLGIRFELGEDLTIVGPDGRPFVSFVEISRQRDESKALAEQGRQAADRERQAADRERREAERGATRGREGERSGRRRQRRRKADEALAARREGAAPRRAARGEAPGGRAGTGRVTGVSGSRRIGSDRTGRRSGGPRGSFNHVPGRSEIMRVLSGIQPSGALHIGNYFGAIRQYIDLQRGNDAFYFVADYHALTSVRDAGRLRGYVFDVIVDLLALGLDPESPRSSSSPTSPRRPSWPGS